MTAVSHNGIASHIVSDKKMGLEDLFDYYNADGYKWSSNHDACNLDAWVNEYMLGNTSKWLKNFLTEDIAGTFNDDTSDLDHWDLIEATAYLDARLDAFDYAGDLTLETTVYDLFSNDGETLVDLYEDMVTRYYNAPVGAF
jgi:hypothetical protein